MVTKLDGAQPEGPRKSYENAQKLNCQLIKIYINLLTL
jgi:hypothetical protein